MKTVFLVTNIPTPYRLPLFNEIARQFSEIGLRLKVLFSAPGYARREWRVDWTTAAFEYEILGGRALNLGSPEAYSFFFPGLLGRIRRERPAAVIVGGFGPAALLLRVSKFLTGVPLIIWSGEIRRQGMVRSLFRRWLVRGAIGLIAYGSTAKRYLESLGADPRRVAIAINTVDTSYFGSHYPAREKRPKNSPHRLVSVSGLFERKQMDALIRTAAHLRRRRDDFTILIIGNGPERSALEALSRELQVAEVVEFVGFQQNEYVAKSLREADCFLFPTRFDIWGLVLVEAMAAGVPCISSIHAGATADLIEEGKTGYAVDFGDVETVCARINVILDNPQLSRAMGAAAHEMVTHSASLKASARGFVKAIHLALPSEPARENSARTQLV